MGRDADRDKCLAADELALILKLFLGRLPVIEEEEATSLSTGTTSFMTGDTSLMVTHLPPPLSASIALFASTKTEGGGGGGGAWWWFLVLLLQVEAGGEAGGWWLWLSSSSIPPEDVEMMVERTRSVKLS